MRNTISDSKGQMALRHVRAISLAGISAVLVAAGCRSESEAAPGPGRAGGAPTRAVPVETAIVESGHIEREVTVSGVVEPIRTVAVNSQLAGAVLELFVEEGSRVREGDVLARIDDRELAAQEESALANHVVAQAAFERAQTLYDRQVITIDEFERDRTAFAAAQAQLDQIRTRRGYATIRAPVAGVVLEKRIEAGDVVGTQTQLFTIGDVSTLVVRVQVSEMDVVSLRPGDPARVNFDAFPGRTFTGTIRRIFPSADPSTRLVPVEVALDGDLPARPGFLARVSLALGGKADAVLVPTRAIVSTAGGQTVFLAQDGVAVARSIQVGMTAQGRIEITSGLLPGDVIVVTGANDLRDGTPLRILAGPGSETGESVTRPAVDPAGQEET